MKKGFTLIELLVVIAIVALISAIALPAYRSYNSQAKVGALLPTMSNLVERSKEYYNLNGVYPNATELGLASTNGTTVTTPSSVAPNMTLLEITPFPSLCGGHFGTIAATFDGDYIGIDSGSYNLMYFIYEGDGGVINVTCMEGNASGEYNYGYAKCSDLGMTSSDYYLYLLNNACN